jgi:hypothetical protein
MAALLRAPAGDPRRDKVNKHGKLEAQASAAPIWFLFPPAPGRYGYTE